MPPKRTLIVLTAAVAIVFGIWTLRSGIRLGVDTATYSKWADLLIAAGFNFSRYLREQQFVAPPLMYLAWVTVVAVLKTTLGSSWMTGIVVLNWIAFSVGVYLTLDAVRNTTQSAASLLLAAMLFLTAADLLIFVPYVLSDLMFWGLSTAVLGCAIALVATDDERPDLTRTIVIGSVLALIAFTFRPVAIPLIMIWLIAIATSFIPRLVTRFAIPLLIAAAIGAVATIVVDAGLLQNPAAWPFGSQPGMLTMVGAEYRQGIVVHAANPPILVTPPSTVFDFVRITSDKLLFFLTPWLPYYSRAHQIINLLFFLPAYGLWIAALRNFRRLSPPQQRAAWLLTLFVMFVTVFHAMALIDSDHRYRLPLLPAFIMLAALGLESVRRPNRVA